MYRSFVDLLLGRRYRNRVAMRVRLVMLYR